MSPERHREVNRVPHGSHLEEVEVVIGSVDEVGRRKMQVSHSKGGDPVSGDQILQLHAEARPMLSPDSALSGHGVQCAQGESPDASSGITCAILEGVETWDGNTPSGVVSPTELSIRQSLCNTKGCPKCRKGKIEVQNMRNEVLRLTTALGDAPVMQATFRIYVPPDRKRHV